MRQLEPRGGEQVGDFCGGAAVLFEILTPGAAYYLELSYLDVPHARPAMLPILKNVHGGAMLVLAAQGIEALQEKSNAAVYESSPLESFELMPLDGQAGSSLGPVKVIIPAGNNHPVYFNACEYFDRSSFLDPAYTYYLNTARYIIGYTIEAGAPSLDAGIVRCRVICGMDGKGRGDVIRFHPANIFADVRGVNAAGRTTVSSVHIVFDNMGEFERILCNEDIGYHICDDVLEIPGNDVCSVNIMARQFLYEHVATIPNKRTFG